MQNQVDNLSLNSRNSGLCSIGMCNCAVAVGLILILSFCFGGCSSAPKHVVEARQVAESAYEIQKPVMVRTFKNDDRPDWTKQTVFEDGGKIHFTGAFLKGSDYSVTVRCANAEAVKVAVQSISNFIRTEFSGYAQGSNSGSGGIDRYVSDGVAIMADNIHVQGIRQKELYYEELFSAGSMDSVFNVWVCLEMSMADYLKAKADVIRGLQDKFETEGRIEAKKKAEDLLEELKKGVGDGTRQT